MTSNLTNSSDVSSGAWLLPELFKAAGLASEAVSVPSVCVTSITSDSRSVIPGSLYVAVRGAVHDGTNYVESACSAGAVAVVAQDDVSVPSGVVFVRVRDAREALSRLAFSFFGLASGQVDALDLVGITGTNGKTTVAWMLRSILRAAGRSPSLLGTIEYDLVDRQVSAPLTTPGAVTICEHLSHARAAGSNVGLLEVSSHALDQRRTDGLRFNAGVFTNLSGDHLDYHGTMESYWQAKRRLFDSLDSDAFAIANYDDPAADLLTSNLRASVVTVGLDAADLDVRATIERADWNGSLFRLKGRTFEVPVTCRLAGRHNVLNAALAAATAEALGIESEAIARGINQLNVVPGRLERVSSDGFPFAVFVDYAHTDDALHHVLQVLSGLTGGRVLCVFGCGGDRDRTKRTRMGTVVGNLADVAFVTSDNPRTENPQQIIDDILPGFDSATSCRIVADVDRRRAIEQAIGEAQPGDTVLIAGKGHETYQLVGDQTLSFDDARVARASLSKSNMMERVS